MKNGLILNKSFGGHMSKFRSFLAIFAAVAAVSMVSLTAQAAGKPDKTIEQKVAHEINMLPNYGIFDHITFQVSGNTVTLAGKVLSLGTKSQAAGFVKRIPGVVSVVNNIEELPPSPMDNDIRRQLLREFSRGGLSGYFWETKPDVRVIVENGHVTLEGFVMNSGDSNAMNLYANNVFGVFSVKNNLIVGNPADR